MATFNGEKYVQEQIDSILMQLSRHDELVVVDDGSCDETPGMLLDLASKDARIKCFLRSSNLGVVPSFEASLSFAAGEFVFLSDQDDIWVDGRVEAMNDVLRNHLVVAGNYHDSDSGAGPRRSLAEDDDHRMSANILGLILGRRPYFGSCMGMHRDLFRWLLPFPRSVELHDHWIAILGNVLNDVAHLAEPVTQRRFHEKNFSTRTRRSLASVARTRAYHFALIMEAGRRVRSLPRSNTPLAER